MSACLWLCSYRHELAKALYFNMIDDIPSLHTNHSCSVHQTTHTCRLHTAHLRLTSKSDTPDTDAAITWLGVNLILPIIFHLFSIDLVRYVRRRQVAAYRCHLKTGNESFDVTPGRRDCPHVTSTAHVCYGNVRQWRMILVVLTVVNRVYRAEGSSTDRSKVRLCRFRSRTWWSSHKWQPGSESQLWRFKACHSQDYILTLRTLLLKLYFPVNLKTSHDKEECFMWKYFMYFAWIV